MDKDFNAEKIVMAVQQLFTSRIYGEKELDLNERDVWKSDSLIIVPAQTKVVHLKTNQIEIRPAKATSSKLFLQVKLNNAKTFNDMSGYALFRNMKIEPLHKHRHDNDREK